MKVKQNGVWESSAVKMQVKQNEVWKLPPEGIQWKLNGVWKPDVSKYVLATDNDFSGNTDGSFRYIGTDEYVEIPHVIKGVSVTSYARMFQDTLVKGVKSTNKNVTDMFAMFYNSKATSLDLSLLDTSRVTEMGYMFYGSQATSLDLSSFDTSNVTDMTSMFYYSLATNLDLSSFDTSNVTNMNQMFSNSKATSLDLSSFDTSNVEYVNGMFRGSQATTGYARTQTDADKFNRSSNKPVGLTFVVKD